MALIALENVTIGYRGPTLLEKASCRIEDNQHIGLLGRNGAGKTTLMRLILGLEQPDDGQVVIPPDKTVTWLPQDVPQDMSGNVRDTIALGLANSPLAEWERNQKVEQLASRMQLDLDASCNELSSGWKRRVLLAQAIVSEPDLLCLDEPTNHLDIESIRWLETFLSKWQGSLLFVTHDRAFLRKIAKRILEIDRGRIFDWTCDYDTFLVRKEEALKAEEKQNALFDKKLAEEEVWIRQGIKARRTRNEGRVRALKQLRLERSQRRERTGKSKLQLQEFQKSGQLVAEAHEVSFGYGDKTVIRSFSTAIMRGDKIGVLGPNGAGKTTLIKLLLGQLEPQTGTIRLGTNIELAYFDQLREQLDLEQTVQENVGEGATKITINGNPKHVLGYLQDFLFTPERARMQVKFLSGGERHRILLAKLFAKPANVIVLDEPTNDLDTETLELLEEKLVAFEGTVIVVSHDRAFLNNVVTSTIAISDEHCKEYDGGYDDWLRQSSQDPKPQPASQRAGRNKSETAPDANRSQKLSYKEKQEYEKLPDVIDSIEQQISTIHTAMSVPDFYKGTAAEVKKTSEQLKQLETELEAALLRWEELSLRDN
ncbi:MAG: ATP-binding cassette domain-containing protein [Planctomycetota bacterium]|nr:ATP-binding cassette domain-containing protein [Planctomycetota bacterium]MEC9095250.1 ATP-binding cassette domain-containing protein [Planctomycetota bacterium]